MMQDTLRSSAAWLGRLLVLPLLWAGPGAAAARADSDQTIAVNSGSLHVTINGTATNDAVVLGWVRRSAEAVSGYFGRFPVPLLELRVTTIPGRKVRHGVTFGGRRPTIRISVGDSATASDLDDDWVLVHELSHLAFPDLTSDDSWAEEGLSTYVEPWARVRAGSLAVTRAWAGVLDGMPKAHLGTGPGLHGTHEWGPTYWGGALFWLMADVEIHERSHGKLGLRDALRGILDKGGDIRAQWSLAKTLETGDQAVGMPVLSGLYSRYGAAPGTVDLADLWRRLGVRPGAEGVAFDDAAPLSALRRQIDGSAR